MVTRSPHAEHQVAGNVVALEWLQSKVVRDALLELAHVGLREAGVQFRLPEEHDLQQLVPVGFQIRKQPDLFQRLGRHGMRFVDQDYYLLAGGIDFDQAVL